MIYATCFIGDRVRILPVIKLNTYTVWVKMAKVIGRFSKPVTNHVKLHIRKHNVKLGG